MLPPPPHNFFLFELDFDIKFSLLRLLLFLSDLKSTINNHFMTSQYCQKVPHLSKIPALFHCTHTT